MTDSQKYFTLLTDKGKFKIAAAAANKTQVKFSHFAIGDGNGQEVNPTPSQTALVHEVWRTQLDSVEIDPKNPAAVIINAIIPHNAGGWWMREFGLFDTDGDMLAVVKPAPYYKATSNEGQLEDVFYEFQLVIGEQAQVVVLVDPSILWATREYVETRRISSWQFMNTPWLAVKAIDLATPPTENNSQGDTYLVPQGAKGDWKDKAGQLAEWNGKAWQFMQPQDGHGIGLKDGQVLQRISGQYRPQVALDVQSGKWLYAEAGGTADALTATLTPKPMGIWAGVCIRLKTKAAKAVNTGPATLDLNGFGAKPIIYHETGEPLVGGDFQAGDVISLIFDGTSWRLQPTIAYLDKRYSRLIEPPSSNFYVIGPTGNDDNSGLSATPQEGFATIQGAINAISKRYLTRSTVTINVSPGTYNGFSVVGSLVQNWQIIGNPNNPQSVVISARDVAGKNVRGCVVYAGSVRIKGMTFRAYYEGAAASGGNLSIHDCSFELSPQNPVIGAYRSQVSLFDTITFSGSTSAHVFSLSQGGSLVFGYTDIITYTPVNVRYLAGTSCGQNMYLDSSSTAIINPRSCTFTGTLNGKRYSCSTNSVILTYGGGEGYLPGTQAGVLYSGGQIS